MKNKTCSKCGIKKKVSEFNKCNQFKDGLQYKCKLCFKEYRDKTKEKRKKYDKKYYLKNRRKRNIHSKNWRKQNKEKMKREIRKYMKKRRRNDPEFKLLGNLRNRLNHVLKGKVKSLSTMMLIGCEIDYLMYHIQNQFAEGMNWDNYGAWHIDHIKPCALFDLSKPEEQSKCFNYTNLQPLWAIDNLQKSFIFNKGN